MGLLEHRSDHYSQNGEDGILAEIFSRIGSGNRFCVEFGAWDGLHFSNTRTLVEKQGWGGAFIEMEAARHLDLVRNCAGYPGTYPVLAAVGIGKQNLANLLRAAEVPLPPVVDLLSIDVDGLDHAIMSDLGLKARVIVVEVNAGHPPESVGLLPTPVAAHNVGQPLTGFVEEGRKMGMRLVAYNGNAFFVADAEAEKAGLAEMSPVQAYEEFLASLSRAEKEWLWMVNRAAVPPFYRYGNHRLTAQALGLGPFSILKALWRVRNLKHRLGTLFGDRG